MSEFYSRICREGGRHPYRCLIAKTVCLSLVVAAVYAALGLPSPVMGLFHFCWKRWLLS